MKKVLFLFISVFLSAQNELYEPILIPREKTPNVFDPSIIQKPKLQMIINHKAKINGKWYRSGEKFSQYIITQISANSATLKNANQTLILYTQKETK